VQQCWVAGESIGRGTNRGDNRGGRPLGACWRKSHSPALLCSQVASNKLKLDAATWETLYHSAVLELNPQKLVDRILAAETACRERRKALYKQAGASPELQAIADAEQNLRVLRKQLITPSLVNERSHTHPELSGECIAFVNANRQYVAVSEGVCKLLGYSRAELIGKTIDEITAPEIVKTVPRRFQQYVEEGSLKGEFVLIGRDGGRIPIRYDARVFPDGCLVARWERVEEQSNLSGGMRANGVAKMNN
jgi:PAS domain S-box-containing protein